MIFLTKILAITAASVSVNNMATENMFTQSQEQRNINHNKERLIEKISELRHEIEKINRYYQDLKSVTADIFENGESVNYLTRWVAKQKNNIDKLSDAIKENNQTIEHKSKFLESLMAKYNTLGEEIRLQKIEIEKLITQKAESIISIDNQSIIQKKQEEKKSVLAKMRVINKKIKSSKIKIDEKTDEIFLLRGKLSQSIEALDNIDAEITQSYLEQPEVLFAMNELFESSIENVGMYSIFWMAAKQEKHELEIELQQFWASTVLKKIEYKKRLKEIKKDIAAQQEVIIHDENNINQMNELLVSNEMLYKSMWSEIQTKKEEITFHTNNQEKLNDSFVSHNKRLVLMEKKLIEKNSQTEKTREEIKQKMINNELEKSNNYRNYLVKEKHSLEQQLVELYSKSL